MKNTLIALAFIGTLLVSGIAGAQNQLAKVAVNRSSDTSTAQRSLSDLPLSYDDGELLVVLSSSDEASLSPATTTTNRDERATGTVFQAVHTYTSLSEVIDYYWNALTSLGFEGTIDAVTADTSSYTFTNDDNQLTAVFTWQGDKVAVDLAWI